MKTLCEHLIFKSLTRPHLSDLLTGRLVNDVTSKTETNIIHLQKKTSVTGFEGLP